MDELVYNSSRSNLIYFVLFCVLFFKCKWYKEKKISLNWLMSSYGFFALSVFGFFLGTALDFYLSAMRPVSFNANLFFEWCDFSLHFSETQIVYKKIFCWLFMQIKFVRTLFTVLIRYLVRCRFQRLPFHIEWWLFIYSFQEFGNVHFNLCSLNVRGSINFDETTTCKVTFLQLTLNCFGLTEFISNEFCSNWIILMFEI